MLNMRKEAMFIIWAISIFIIYYLATTYTLALSIGAIK